MTIQTSPPGVTRGVLNKHKMIMDYIVYQIKNKVNGKLYIGITSKSITERWRVHIKKSKKHDWPISKAIKKYGIESFEITELYSNVTAYSAKRLEKALIKKYNTYNKGGYNATKGGDGGNTYSVTKINSGIFKKGQTPWNKGRTATEEEKTVLKSAKIKEGGVREYRRYEVIRVLDNQLFYYKDKFDAAEEYNVKPNTITSYCSEKIYGWYYLKDYKNMIKYLVCLDPGHGPQTLGKRSPVWEDGRQLFEHEFNWDISQRIKRKLGNDITVYITRPIDRDEPLSARVNSANSIAKNFDYSLYLSIHANAGGGTGWEVFTSEGETDSDEYATIFYEETVKQFPDRVFRKDTSDGDVDKESQFYVLKHTWMPAVLTENFFMDTLSPDCEIIMSEDGRDKIADAHVSAIKRIIKIWKNEK